MFVTDAPEAGAPAAEAAPETPGMDTGATEAPATTPEGTTPAEGQAESPTPEPTRAEIEAEIRAEYEKAGTGHIAKLKAAAAKREAALKAQLQARQQAELEQARSLMQSDPARAAQLAMNAAEQGAQMDQQAQARQQWEGFVVEQLEAAGLDLADEATTERAAADTERLFNAAMAGGGPELALDYQGKLLSETVTARDKAAAKQAKMIEDKLAEVDKTIQAAVTRQLAAAGLTPDPTTGESGPPPEPDTPAWKKLSPKQQLRYALAADAERMAKEK